MRSLDSTPDGPWPHDMVITVEDRPHALLELLWVREAYGLRVAGEDLPPQLVDTPRSVDGVTEATRSEWQAAWPRVWRAAAVHAGRDDSPQLMERLQATANGSPERVDLLHELFGPSWREEFGDDVFDDSYRAWEQRGIDWHMGTIQERLQDSPEHRDVEALTAAWNRGLTKVVTIPCQGEFSRAVSPTALLMTDATRADSDAYRRALGSFA